MDSQDLPQKILSLINGLSTAGTNEERAKFEKDIEDLISNRRTTLPYIFQLALDRSLPKGTNEYLFILLRKMANDMMNSSQEEADFMGSSLMSAIFNPQVDITVRAKFADVLKLATSPPIAASKVDPSVIIKNFALGVVYSYNFEDNPLLTEDLDTILGILLTFKAIFNSTNNTANINKLFNEHFEYIFKFFDSVINPKVIELASENFNKSRIADPNVSQKCEYYLLIIENYAKLIKVIIKALKGLRQEKTSVLARNVNFLQKLQTIVFLRIGNLAVNVNNFLYNPTEYEGLNKKLSGIKKKVIFVYQILFDSYLKKKDAENSTIETFYKSIAKTIIESLYSFFTKTELKVDRIEDDTKLNEYLKLSLKYLNISVTYIEHLELYMQTKKFLLKDIIFHCLKAGETEIDNADDNPNDFINYTNDVLRSQRSKTLKVQMAKLLNNLCANVDGVLTYVVYVILDMLKFICEKGTQETLLQYPYYSELLNSNYLKNADSNSLVESGLLILTIIARHLGQRDDLLKLFENFIQSYSVVISNGTNIVRVRYIYFLVVYMGRIFDESDTMKTEVKSQLYNWLLQQLQGPEIVSLAALANFEFLLKAARSQDKASSKILFSTLANSFVSILIDLIKNTSFKGPLKLMALFLNEDSYYFASNPENFKNLILSIKENIIKAHEEQNKDMRELTTMSWNCYKLVCDKEILVKTYYEFLTDQISGFFDYILNGQKIDWDEDIFHCFYSIINISKQLPQSAEKIFSAAQMLQTLYNGKLSYCISLLSLMIYTNPGFFDSNKVHALFEMVHKSLDVSNYKNEAEYYLVDGFLLLEVIIQHLGELLSQEQIDKCFSYYDYFNDYVNNMDFDKKALLVDKNEGIILSLLFKIPDRIIEKLLPNMNTYVSHVINSSIFFETTYEIKLLNLGLISLVSKLISLNNPEYTSAIIQLFNFLVVYMKFIENLQFVKSFDKIQERRKLNSTEMKYYDIKDELLENLPFNENVYPFWFEEHNRTVDSMYDTADIDLIDIIGATKSLYNEKQNLAGSIISVIYFIDEYYEFKQLIIKLRQQGELYTNLVNNLTPSARKYINDVAFKTKYVQLDMGEDSRRLRRIVKVKRVNN